MSWNAADNPVLPEFRKVPANKAQTVADTPVCCQNLHLLKGFDSKPRGCAMVLFQRWSQAEAAAEALNGKTNQLVGQTRPLVVHFANPRRNPQGPPEPGIAPCKLFIGQVSLLGRTNPQNLLQALH